MAILPEVDHDPFGLSRDELAACAEEASEEAPGVPYEVALAKAMERALVIKEQKPDPWTSLFITNYAHLRRASAELSFATEELIDRARPFGVLTEDIQEALHRYHANFSVTA